MNILITGANGFLGSEIVQQLTSFEKGSVPISNKSLQVSATDKQDKSLRPGIVYHPADILDPASLVTVVAGAECVIHAAGLAHIFDKTKAAHAPFKGINEIGTLNVAQAAVNAGVRHFILISSVSVYGKYYRPCQ